MLFKIYPHAIQTTNDGMHRAVVDILSCTFTL